MNKHILPVTSKDVESRIVIVRGQHVLLDRDVAELYGVETKRINEAVKNNPEKFPPRCIIYLDEEESAVLRSKFSTIEPSQGKGHYSKYNFKAFTERGLYMLATILKSPRATQTTLAIIDTFVEVREMARTMEALQNVIDGGTEQQSLLQKTGQLLATVVGNNLSTASTETEIELNFAVVKIKHKFIRKDEDK
ncbi:MAG: ORF6N domain-containing protein [Prevotella sp.]|nr:ORF6N domain-containing protein [Prevotella sp.]MDY3742840.1 ORF6N domain-containing protein [Prevotella sp.]